MARAKVTFFVEQDDPGHESGVTEDTYNFITRKVIEAGGEDIEIVAMHEGDDLEESEN